MRELSELSELEVAIGSGLAMAQLGRGGPPQIDERFQIEKLLGRGSFGLVVRAHDPTLNRKVAIKCLPSTQPRQLFDEVATEAQALAAVNVPQVAQIYDCKIADIQFSHGSIACVVIVMEHVEGPSLRRWAREVHSRTEQIEVLVAAAKGLEAAHAASIIHRDFKPENVVVPASRVARVVDFGLAYHTARAPSTQTHLRQSAGVMTGTPEYMAPEVRRGQLTMRSDQFSFAVAAWEVLTGKRPVIESTQLVATHENGEQLPRTLADALGRALDFQPERRFDSLAPLRDALERCEESVWQKHGSWMAGAAALGMTAAGFMLGRQSGLTKRPK